jgi:hypothetical protein
MTKRFILYKKLFGKVPARALNNAVRGTWAPPPPIKLQESRYTTRIVSVRYVIHISIVTF